MKHSIRRLSPIETFDTFCKQGFHIGQGSDNGVWQRFIALTSCSWIGIMDGEIACMWGIIPPTLLSNQCYLWLNTTEALRGNEFLFVRKSQRVIEDILGEYPEITGHVIRGQDQSIRWLGWLGADFGEPEELFIPFVIRAKQDD